MKLSLFYLKLISQVKKGNNDTQIPDQSQLLPRGERTQPDSRRLFIHV